MTGISIVRPRIAIDQPPPTPLVIDKEGRVDVTAVMKGRVKDAHYHCVRARDRRGLSELSVAKREGLSVVLEGEERRGGEGRGGEGRGGRGGDREGRGGRGGEDACVRFAYHVLHCAALPEN